MGPKQSVCGRRGLNARMVTGKGQAHAWELLKLAMASQRLFIPLFLLRYNSEIIQNKKLKEKKIKKEKKGPSRP